MKNIIVLLALLVLAEVCAAEMVILKDGTTLDAVTLEDKGEVIEAVTRFGTLNINRSEIDNLAELGLAAKPAEAGVPAGEKPPAREEPPVYRPEPPARAPAAPKAAGILSKPQTVFLTPEVFSVGGADKKWEENYEAGFDLIASIWDYTSGEFKSYPGFGVTFGVNFGAYKDSPGYIAFSYIKGPSAEIDMTFNDSVFGPGYYNEEVETSFMRFVGGYKFVSPIEGNSLFFIDLNGGFGRGKVESSYSENSFLGYYSGSASESWSGMTWSASPGIAWEYPGYILELGARYTVFPRLKDSDTFSDISWRPFSLYLNFVF